MIIFGYFIMFIFFLGYLFLVEIVIFFEKNDSFIFDIYIMSIFIFKGVF